MVAVPTHVLAYILGCLGEAGEVVRAASSSKAMWAAAAGPLHQVHTLVLRCAASDLQPQLLLSLQQRFPNIQHLHVADGSWRWDGSHSLAAWAASLTDLRANATSFPLLAVLPAPSTPPQQQQQMPAGLPLAVAALAGNSGSIQHLQNQQAGRSSERASHHHHQQQQYQQQQGGQHQRPCRTSTAVPGELQGLVRLQVQNTVTSTLKCRQHGSSTCACLDFTVLAALLQQNPHLSVLDLAGNSCMPDRLLHAAVLAATCRQLKTLDLSGCELVRPGGYVPDAFPGLVHLDVSNTATADADVQALLEALPLLQSLSIAGCRRVSNAGIDALAAAPALVNGCLTSLDLGGLTRPGPTAMACLTAAWAAAAGCKATGTSGGSSCSSAPGVKSSDGNCCRCAGPHRHGVQLHMGFARTACITDEVLQPFVDAAAGGAPSHHTQQQQQQRQQHGQQGCGDRGGMPSLLQQLDKLAVTTQTAQHSASQQQQRQEQQQQEQQQQRQEQQQHEQQQQHEEELSTQMHSLQQHPEQEQERSEQLRGLQQLSVGHRVLPVSLCGLHLAGCTGVSGSMLVQLGAAGALATLTSLDLSDAEAFRQPVHMQHPQQQQRGQQQHLQLQPPHSHLQPPQQQQQQQQRSQGDAADASEQGALCLQAASCSDDTHSSSSSSSKVLVSRSMLPQLLQHTGQHLQLLLLDGCYIDDAAAAAIAAQGLPALQELSLVNCRGLGNTGLRSLLGSLPSLRALALGGSVSAWSEGPVLQGLPAVAGLTQLRLIRRPVLRDAELAAVLRQGCCLRSLSLVGCYMLTDKVFELATAAEGAALAGPHVAAVSHMQHVDTQSLTVGSASGSGEAAGMRVVPLQQLTHLSLTACDGVSGASMARLQSLRHLRISFCASLSPAALQHVVVSCRKLHLLELPASLSGQGLGFSVVRFDGPSPVSHQQQHRGGHGGPSRPARAGSGGGFAGRGRGGGGVGGVGGSSGGHGLVLPRQGAGQSLHLDRLKVNWL